MLRKYAEAVRHFGGVPAYADIRMYSREQQDFPDDTTFTNHFGNKTGLLAELKK